MENQQQSKIMGVMMAVFILMIIVTISAVVVFLTEKNKLVRQSQISNGIIREFKENANVSVKKNVMIDDETVNNAVDFTMINEDEEVSRPDHTDEEIEQIEEEMRRMEEEMNKVEAVE